MINNIIKYIDAPAGFGKTYSAIKEIKRLDDGLNPAQILIITKTNALGLQWQEDLYSCDLRRNIICINSDNTDYPIKKLKEALDKKTNDIIIMSETAWLILNANEDMQDKEHKIVFYDELPQPQFVASYHIPITHNLLTDLLKVEEKEQGIYTCTIKNRQKTQNYLKEKDEVYEKFSNLLNMTLAKHIYAVSVNKSVYDNYLNGKSSKDNLDFYITVDDCIYHGFKEFYLLGALFGETLLKRCFKKTQFVNHTHNFGIQQGQKHVNGNRLTICYLTEGNWSKTLLQKQSGREEGETYWDVTAKYINQLDCPALVYCNTNVNTKLLNEKFTILSPVQIGVNKYSDFTTSIFLAALVPSNEEVNYYSKQGITREDIVRSRSRYAMYQALFRDNMRDQTSHKPVMWIVPTKDDAEWLASQFVETSQPQIKFLDSGIGYSLKNNQFDPERKKEINDYINGKKKTIKNLSKQPDTFTFVSNLFNENVYNMELSQDDFFLELQNNKTKGETHVIGCAFNNSLFKSAKKTKDAFTKLDCKLTYDNHKFSNGLAFDFDLDDEEPENKAEIKECVVASLLNLGVKFLVRDSSTPGNFHVWIKTAHKMDKDVYKDVQHFFSKMFFAYKNDKATEKAVQKIHIDKGQVNCEIYDGGALDIINLMSTKEFKDIINDRIEQEIKENTITNESNKTAKTNHKKADDIINVFNQNPCNDNIYGLVKGLKLGARMTDKEIENICFSSVPYFIGHTEHQKELKRAITK